MQADDGDVVARGEVADSSSPGGGDFADREFGDVGGALFAEEGRGVFDNLTKFIAWTLPTNLGEGLVILAAIVAGQTSGQYV